MTNDKHQILSNMAMICAEKGINAFVISPGSRSAPLTTAFNRHAELKCWVVMDERAAGFIAMGMAQQQRQAVGLVCTSGTAALNYGPAVAEAYYQQIPLLIFTADRPPEWINQQDNQTIRQANLYGPHCRGWFELPVDYGHPDAQWHAERIMSEAINLAQWPVPGPVQINVPLREPLYPSKKTYYAANPKTKVIRLTTGEATLASKDWDRLKEVWQAADKKLVVAGLYPPHSALTKALANLQANPSVAIIGDITANIQPKGSPLSHADCILGTKSEMLLENLRPDLLVSFGGPVVSKHLKLFLRRYSPKVHWHIDPSGQSIDTFKTLTDVIAVSPHYFFKILAKKQSIANNLIANSYQNYWLKLNKKATKLLNEVLSKTSFNEFLAVHEIMKVLPANSNLQLGNSMAIRYANYIGLGSNKVGKHIVVNANRGVSGIDGCLSTTVGAALSTKKISTLITGDLAFFYDRNGLWHNHLPSNLRIIILNNGGGGIFKLIDGPSNLEQTELETYFFTPHPLTAKETAIDYGCDYFCCVDMDELRQCLPKFFRGSSKASILEIKTDSTINTQVFKNFKTQIANLVLSQVGFGSKSGCSLMGRRYFKGGL